MKKDKDYSLISVGFTQMLTIAFIVLKLCKVINWSWWWVLAPIWGWIPLTAVIVVIMIIDFIITEHRKANKAISNLKKDIGLPKSKFQQRMDDYMVRKKSNA